VTAMTTPLSPECERDDCGECPDAECSCPCHDGDLDDDYEGSEM
jgi:hypothetical protein